MSEEVKIEQQEEPEKQEETKITAEPEKKEKDPKKVAQGKRLAQISKQAKEKKMREKIAEESRLFDLSVNYNTLLYFGVPSVVFAGMYLYFSRKNQQKVQVHYSPAKKPETKNGRANVSLFD